MDLLFCLLTKEFKEKRGKAQRIDGGKRKKIKENNRLT
jgi:hypothetical protein